MDIFKALMLNLSLREVLSNVLINHKGDWSSGTFLFSFYLGEWSKCKTQVGKKAEVNLIFTLFSSQITEN